MQGENDRTEEERRPNAGRGWGLLWLVFMIWLVFSMWPRPREAAEVPYSTFLTQVREGNVESVRIAGSEITGTFEQAVTWPQPTPANGEATPPGNAPAPAPAPSPFPGMGAPETPRPYQRFETTFPEVVGDEALLPLLREQDVTVEVAQPASPWLAMLLANALPLLLLVLFFVWMGRNASRAQSGIFDFGRTRARRYDADRPTVTFADVAGVEEAKTELQQVVDFLREPKKYRDLGARIPRGVLLSGPPGTGKTLLARAVAGEAGVPFFSLSGSEFVEMLVGVGASRVRDLFERAKKEAPVIIFIDELDAVGRRRGAGLGTVNDEREQTLNQLLAAMDGFEPHQEVIVLAATNRPDVLDPALLRPGRFDRQVEVGLPDRKGREAILRIHSRKLPIADDVRIEEVANGTTGFSGAQLANLCNEAALVAALRNQRMIAMEDFEEARDKVMMGGKRALVMDKYQRRIVAYHEAGHAVVAWLTPQADPVHKVTVVPRGRALGVTAQLPEEERYNFSREYLLARLSVLIGGRVAEELVCGDITTGAENDLVEATRLTRRMVTRWGMGSLGFVAFETDDEQPFLGYSFAHGKDYADATAARIDQDVQRLLEERHEYVRRLLTDNQDGLERLTEALLEQETVGQEALEEILGPRRQPQEITVVRRAA